jgi:hypothetical protein
MNAANYRWTSRLNWHRAARKTIGRPPAGRKVICCTGIATWFFLSSKENERMIWARTIAASCSEKEAQNR